MKMFAGVLFATAIASPALAQSPQAPPEIVPPPAVVMPPPTIVEPPAGDAFARAPLPRRSPNPAWDVYVEGKYVGSDPDPLVRDQLRRDAQNPGQDD